MPPTVAVLLSTYNGKEFLDAQLASLCGQWDVAVRIFVRDDGSSDGTLALLHKWAARTPQIVSVSQGVNLGAAWSFLTLLRDAPDGFDYYAFCDQDDVWLPGKLARATGWLRDFEQDEPALYCSQVSCVDRDLTPLGQPPANGDTSFRHLLFENIAFGCTTVMSRSARDSIVGSFPSSGLLMHDWWCALVVAGLGRLLYDPESYILYRQHGQNTWGVDVGFLGKLRREAFKFWRDPARFYPVHAQTTELLRLYGSRLPAERRAVAGTLVRSKSSMLRRTCYALSDAPTRNRLFDGLVARTLVLANRY